MNTAIIGHRGAAFDAPENTLSSFKLAFAQGADGIECDVHLTRDQKIVAIHDPDMTRLSGVAAKIAEHTFEELRQWDVSNWGPWAGKGLKESLPTLEKVLALVPEDKSCVIEIKCGVEILPSLRGVLESSHVPPEQTVLIGFGYETMRQAKLALPDRPVFWLAESDERTGEYPSVSDLVRSVRGAGLDGLDLHAGFPIDKAFVEVVHQAALMLYTWTVDDAERARELMAAGVDAITTNRPGWLRERLTRKLRGG